MDGVIVDWFIGARNLGLSIDIVDSTTNSIENKKIIWNAIDRLGSVFWTNLKWTSDGRQLWDFLKPYNVSILSSHGKTKDHEGWSKRFEVINGKKDWIARNLGPMASHKCIITQKLYKKKYAGHNSVLIDDDITNIEEWKSAGGIGSLHKNTNDTIKKVVNLVGE